MAAAKERVGEDCSDEGWPSRSDRFDVMVYGYLALH